MNERGAQARVVIAGRGVAALEATLADCHRVEPSRLVEA